MWLLNCVLSILKLDKFEGWFQLTHLKSLYNSYLKRLYNKCIKKTSVTDILCHSFAKLFENRLNEPD